jgi:hypothetical protein
MTVDQMIDEYLLNASHMERSGTHIHLRVDASDEAAVVAFGHHVDGVATLDDLCAYRAWIARHRLEGVSEGELQSSVAVANDMAAKLGVE